MDFIATFLVTENNYTDLDATIESDALTNVLLRFDAISSIKEETDGKFAGRTKVVLFGDTLHPIHVTTSYADFIAALDGATDGEVVNTTTTTTAPATTTTTTA